MTRQTYLFLFLFISSFSFAQNGKIVNKILAQVGDNIILLSDVENQIISSKFVKEIVKLGGDIKKFATKSTIKTWIFF